jgi:hypothetical protein
VPWRISLLSRYRQTLPARPKAHELRQVLPDDGPQPKPDIVPGVLDLSCRFHQQPLGLGPAQGLLPPTALRQAVPDAGRRPAGGQDDGAAPPGQAAGLK